MKYKIKDDKNKYLAKVNTEDLFNVVVREILEEELLYRLVEADENKLSENVDRVSLMISILAWLKYKPVISYKDATIKKGLSLIGYVVIDD